MSITGAQWMAYANPMMDKRARARKRNRAKYCFLDLVRPGGYDRYTVEQQFGIFQWMVKTATPFYKYHHHGPIDLLSANPNCLSDPYVYGISSLADLKRRFQYALLSQYEYPLSAEWKKAVGITITGTKIIAFPHYVPFEGAPVAGSKRSEEEIRKAISALLSADGTLGVQLNSCHDAAREIYGVKVHVYPDRFIFRMSYGFDGSVWTFALAGTREGESFLDTAGRAIEVLAQMKDGTYEKPEGTEWDSNEPSADAIRARASQEADRG